MDLKTCYITNIFRLLLVVLLNICEGGAAKALITMLINNKGVELLALVVKEFIITVVLVNNKGAKLLVIVFTDYMNVIGGLSCLVILLALHIKATLVDIVGTRSLVVLSTGFLAALSLVVFSVYMKGLLATTGVIGAESLNAVFTGCVNTISRASCSAIPLALHVKAASVNIIDARSLVMLGIGLLAALSSVVFLLTTTDVISAELLDVVFTSYVDTIGEASCLVVLLALYVKTVLINVVSIGLLGARSLVALITGFLAV
jgi:hypothetical protein